MNKVSGVLQRIMSRHMCRLSSCKGHYLYVHNITGFYGDVRLQKENNEGEKYVQTRIQI